MNTAVQEIINAKYLRSHGDPRGALEVLNFALKTARRENDRAAMAEARMLMGHIHIELREFDKALQRFKEAESSYSSCDPTKVVEARRMIAQLQG